MPSVTFAQGTTDHAPTEAEQWARAVFERGPLLLRWFVRFGWRWGLGLALGPRDSPDYVAGWRIVERQPERVVLEASSVLLSARNCVELSADEVVWTTVVDYSTMIARPIWLLALPIHKLSLRYLLRRAARRS